MLCKLDCFLDPSSSFLRELFQLLLVFLDDLLVSQKLFLAKQGNNGFVPLLRQRPSVLTRPAPPGSLPPPTISSAFVPAAHY